MPILLFLGSEQWIDVGTFDGATPVIGPQSVALGGPQTKFIDLASFDARTPVVGPSIQLVAIIPPPVPWVPPPPGPAPPVPPEPVPPWVDEFEPGMYAELWTIGTDATPAVKLSDLTTQQGARFQDVFNDVGSGALQLQLDDPDVALVKPGTEVWCYMFGEVVYTWAILAKPRIVLHSEGEEAAQRLDVAGRGRSSRLENAKIYPPKGPVNPVNAQHRLYSFASIDYPNFAGWAPAVQTWKANVINPTRASIVEYTSTAFGIEEIIESVLVPAPIGWPIDDAYWIWSQDDTFEVGTSYFRREFTLTSETNVGFFVTGDNYYTLYLDGTPIVGELVNMHCWQEYKQVDMLLPPGTYYLAAICINSEWPSQYLNPAGFLMAAVRLDNDGKPIPPDEGGNIVVTDSSWSSLAYPGQEPGWTPGQILIDAISEAQARGVVTGFVYDFTAVNDSLGNPWPNVPGFSVPIGGSVMDILKGLVDQGWIDWRVKPGGQVIQVFNQRAIATDSGVTYQATGNPATQNLRSQDFVPQIDVINKYLVKWTYGYFEIQDVASQALWGVYEGFMTVDAPTIENALQQANAMLVENATPLHAIVCEIDPLGDADSPYWAYGPGQNVRVVDADGNLAWKQVQSITVNQNELGRPEIALELEARLQQRQREDYELLSGLGRVLTGDTKQRISRLSWNEGKSATSS